MLKEVAAPLGALLQHLKEVGGLHSPEELTEEDFRLELADLGLLGRPFGPEEYRRALEERLGLEIHVEEIPVETEGTILGGAPARNGDMAEVVIDGETGRAVIVVRESLRTAPWPAYELSLFHELSHLAAGHQVRVVRDQRRRFRSLGSRLAVGQPPKAEEDEDLDRFEEEVLEPEARRRAKWLVLAGTCPRAFEAERANCLT